MAGWVACDKLCSAGPLHDLPPGYQQAPPVLHTIDHMLTSLQHLELGACSEAAVLRIQVLGSVSTSTLDILLSNCRQPTKYSAPNHDHQYMQTLFFRP